MTTPDGLRGNGAGPDDSLHAAGLTPAEVAAYELLISRPGSTLPELAKAWTQAERLDAVMATLEVKGFVTQADDGQPNYHAVDPELALETPLHDYEGQLRRAREHVHTLAAAYRSRFSPASNTTPIEVVSGQRAVWQRLTQLRRGARREICRLDKPPHMSDQGITDLEPLHAGVTSRAIYERASVEPPGSLRDVERFVAAGQQARVLPTLPMRLFLIDGRHAFLPLQSEPASVESAIVVHPSALLDALAKLFDGLWVRALPLELPATRETSLAASRRAPVDEQRLVALLLSGLTDDAIARQFAVGYRTVQRRIAALMVKLGAHTRFQAGVQAALQQRQQAATSESDGRQR